MFQKFSWWVVLLAFGASSVWAGDGYEVTAKQGDKEITYMVNFGGGRRFEQYTAFDPESQKFVYLSWDRKAKPPQPAMTIWDHRTGERIPLYQFPDVPHPLPIIPSIEAMKVCPLTGDKNFKARLTIAYD